jgi:hypothetical protein
MALTWSPKNPAGVADYKVDWTSQLAGDTIASSAFAFIAQAGLTKDSEESDATSSTIWLSGGTAGADATLTCTITTTGGRTFIEEILLPISAGLIIEDGAGLPNAESFVSVEYCVAYCASHGIAFVGSLADQERALRNAAMWLTFAPSWQGSKTQMRAQALAFPRVGVVDREYYPILSNEIPYEVMYAQCELAAYDLANPGALFPTVVPSDRVIQETIGPISIRYSDIPASAAADQNRPVLTKVRDIISGLTAGGDQGGSVLQGTADRA